MFEVLLVSPEGTVIGNINQGQVIIKDSGRKEERVVHLCSLYTSIYLLSTELHLTLNRHLE